MFKINIKQNSSKYKIKSKVGWMPWELNIEITSIAIINKVIGSKILMLSIFYYWLSSVDSCTTMYKTECNHLLISIISTTPQ
jgi:hypothetical protein